MLKNKYYQMNRNLLLLQSIGFGYRYKILCFQRSTSDQATIHTVLCKQFTRIFRLTASSVQNDNVFRKIMVKMPRDHFANKSMHFPGLLRCSRFAGSDRPYRFICKDDTFCLSLRKLTTRFLHLSLNHYKATLNFK